MTTPRTTRFDAEAAAWDSNPAVHLASSLALQTLLRLYPEWQSLSPEERKISGQDVLEIGCGTGLLSLQVAPYVRSLTAVDSARGMIDALRSKLEGEKKDVRNVLPVCVMLVDPDDVAIRADPVQVATAEQQRGSRLSEDEIRQMAEDSSPRRFDLILSHLVLHHIPDLSEVLTTMFGCLKPGGCVALTDFEDFGPEARKFHPESKMEGVERHGIEKGEMKRLMQSAGFVDVSVEVAFEMEKEVEKVPGGGLVGGEGAARMMFPFLICRGRRP
jgi:2-polyprenyl-3-methyl-5-hydroxy-6-metoxy-1,4-benzoquinol methylase